MGLAVISFKFNVRKLGLLFVSQLFYLFDGQPCILCNIIV